MTVTTETEATEKPSFDFSEVMGRAVRQLRAPKIPPVDPAIVRQAQRSWDGVPDHENPDETTHVLSHEFKTEAMAFEFARQMRLAGHHTRPVTSVSAVIDPLNSGNKKLVHWQAGARRGARPASA